VTDDGDAYGVIAVRYAERQARLADVYYGWSYYGEPDDALRMTYYFWILERAGDPPIIVDSGFNPELGLTKGRPCLTTPAEALSLLGIDGTDVEKVVVTHLHWDHIGNLDLFPNAELIVPQRELDFWTTPIARRTQFAHHADFDAVAGLVRASAEGRVRPVVDETEVAPGIVATVVGGHSPGQMIVSVAGSEAGVLLASDAVHYYDELAKDRPFAVVYDLADAYRAFDKVRALTEDGRVFVPAHDPLVWERYPRAEGPASPFAVRIA
jgi:glyoxylase-like metal-dependent hydrolase (beta-lactamase superfamily II)